MTTFIKKFAKCESGATAIEYALLAALISVAIIAAVTTVGGQISATFDNIAESLTAATSS